MKLRVRHLARAGAAVLGVVVVGGLAYRAWRRPPADTSATLEQRWATLGVARPNVVLVTLDTTRADHLGCYGYGQATTPNLDALAARGALFAHAASVAPLTLPAHSSIMTGMQPTYHGVRVNGATALGQSQQTLAEVFSSRGYSTGAFVGAFVLDGRWGLNQGFDDYDDKFDLKKFKHIDLAAVRRPGNEVMDAALGWLASHKQGPFFAWIHLYDAHSPYEPPEPYRSRYEGRGLVGLYDGGIAFADQQVGRLVSWLRDEALDQRTLLVVIGDHGEGLGSHGEGTHGYFVYDYATHVPFLVVTPFDELHGVRIDSQVSSVDLFPTVLGLCGIGSPRVQGRSLLPLLFRTSAAVEGYAYSESMTPNLQFGWSALHSLRSTRYKLIDAPRPELYDLASDPGEETNVIARNPVVASRLSQRLKRLMAETSRDAPAPETADLDRETVQRLAALGYMGAPLAPRTAGGQASLADPKDKLQVFEGVQRAGELILQDDPAAAARTLAAALRDDPDMPQALLMLGGAYAELGRSGDAKAQFDRVLKGDPQNVQALVGMASVLMKEGKTSEVVALGKRTLSLDDRNTQAYALLGEAYTDQNQPAQALPYLEKAVEIQPKLTQNRLNLAGCLIEVRQFARAETLLTQIVRDYPRFPLAQFNLGLLYDEQGRLEQARAAYAEEVAAYPGHFKARFNLGKVLFQLGDDAKAIEEMREVERLAPRLPQGYLFEARGLLKTGAPPERAQALAEQGLALAETPDMKALGWFLLADVFNRTRQPEKMAEALRKADSYVPAGSRPEARHGTLDR
jgi:arylsulfatase A-like enzyme/tetratricopeptide (TPR) repeat protein